MRQLLGPAGQAGDSGVTELSFEDDQMILGKFWDRELVEAFLLLRGQEISDQLVVSAVNGSFVKEGTFFTEI